MKVMGNIRRGEGFCARGWGLIGRRMMKMTLMTILTTWLSSLVLLYPSQKKHHRHRRLLVMGTRIVS